MKIRVVLISLTVFLITLIYLFAPQKVFAVFTLTSQPNPYQGSDDIKFETIDPAAQSSSQVLRIDITSDIGRYELTQNLLSPLTNYASGVTLPDNNFIFYARRRAVQGTLNYAEQDTLVKGIRSIYTSNEGGTSDYFELVYVIKTPLDVPPGLYSARIAFTLRPVSSSTQAQVTKIINISAQIGRGEANIEMVTAAGAKIITLNPDKEVGNSFDVLVNIKGSLGSQFRILQILPEPLKSPSGEGLPYETVNFKVSQASKGTGPVQAQPLSSRITEAYKSGLKGEAESFIITYSLGDLSGVKSGRYKTNIQYRLEGAGGFIKEGLLATFGLEVEIERKFDLAVKTESGIGRVEFRDLKPTQPPKTYEVFLEVNTNLGKRYQVTQNVDSELTSKEGQVMPAKYFTVRTENLDTKGALKFPQKVEVKKGDTVLFVSDDKGSPDIFKIIYELNCPREVKAGDYSTRIAYSLSEI